MMTDPGPRRRPQLGRGLSALFGDSEPAAETDAAAAGTAAAGARTVPIERLFANPAQPRHRFADVELAELARSMRERGVVQPLLVRPRPRGAEGEYEIVAGERRWRAAQQIQLHELPVVIRALDDAQALQVSIIENVQRQDLSCIEEAAAYRRLVEEFGHTQEDLAGIVGKSRSHVANSLRLLNLPAAVRQLLEDGQLTAGHGRALLAMADPAAAAAEVVRRGLSVRQTEALAQRERDGAAGPAQGVAAVPTAAPAAAERPGSRDAALRRGGADEDVTALERDLGERLGLTVRIAAEASGRGRLSIDFHSLEQLDDLVARLSPPPRFMA